MSVKTYKTTDQFIEELKSLDDAKIKQLSAAWSEAWSEAFDAAWSAAWPVARSEAWSEAFDAAWPAAFDAAFDAAWSAAWSEAWSEAFDAARSADLAVLVKDKITAEQFEILTSSWTSCGLSLFVEAEEVEDNSPISRILDQRQEDYGDAKDNFTAIGRMWGALLKIEDIPAWQVALMMDAFKSVRCFANPLKDDSWDDKSGYIHHARDLRPEKERE